ncbi:MAG: flagellar basal body rod protein FlgB [Alphaproteobacteria bacterium]|nr:flagellar basal body rod protein FlgB [Alphaproteobacteria bacterium]MBU1515776.1 flagellar basal body rod protein FlgB [Alphaproteobacteria bacterium]MBU2093998.1 flagellar basal body rod protein FlgB [Alphaproteobacteria bacterium]MBU2153428.1 flagellar basal body rod protein FlgB [Alphaproteobacteria bacterium]MBU2308856.1 flagellar basal body rod protein FlgB [Alphaproteobacteria bacterium]
MNLAEIPLFSMLKGRMGYLSERQKVIAENVANADTAKFVPNDLKPYSFDAKMQAQQMAQAGSASTMAATQAGHMAPKNERKGLGSQFKTMRSPDSEVTLNGNAVVLEDEMIKMTEARMNYDAAISFYQKSMSLLRMAARRPGG